MTWNRDVAAIGNINIASRLAVFPALACGEKYEIGLNNAEQFTFMDAPLLGREGGRNPNHQRVILAMSFAFGDAYLRKWKCSRLA